MCPSLIAAPKKCAAGVIVNIVFTMRSLLELGFVCITFLLARSGKLMGLCRDRNLAPGLFFQRLYSSPILSQRRSLYIGYGDYFHLFSAFLAHRSLQALSSFH